MQHFWKTNEGVKQDLMLLKVISQKGLGYQPSRRNQRRRRIQGVKPDSEAGFLYVFHLTSPPYSCWKRSHQYWIGFLDSSFLHSLIVAHALPEVEMNGSRFRSANRGGGGLGGGSFSFCGNQCALDVNISLQVGPNCHSFHFQRSLRTVNSRRNWSRWSKSVSEAFPGCSAPLLHVSCRWRIQRSEFGDGI